MKLKSYVQRSGHQILLIDKVIQLLLWQQWRFIMAANLHLIQFISKASLEFKQVDFKFVLLGVGGRLTSKIYLNLLM